MSAESLSTNTIKDARISPRLQASGTLEVAFSQLGPSVLVHDINSAGFTIETSQAFKAGSLHDVWFTTEEGTRIALMARAVPDRSRPTSVLRIGARDLAVESIVGFAFMQLQLPATRKRVDLLLGAVNPQLPTQHPAA